MFTNEPIANESFANDPIDVGGLPALADTAFVPVHRNYLRVSLIGMAIFAAVVAIASVIIALAVPKNSWIPLVATAAILALTAVAAGLRILEVRHIAYQVRQHDVSYRSGILIKSVQTVPFVRVQHDRIRQGPIDRWFGLATVEVSSAGPDLAIHGLAAPQAEQLKQLVVERAGDLQEGP